jgi:4-hydroxy-4-methyl-2-oxoglutarate aldolase
MRSVVIRNIERADSGLIARLGDAGVSTVHEAQGRTGLAKPYLRPAWPGGIAFGSAVTVQARPGDNWMIHVAVELCQEGDVLVVGLSSDNYDGMFGELLATSLKAKGVRGLVIDSGCRDVAALKELGFPVWCRGVSAQGTVKASLGAVNIPVVVAGVAVNPGDVVVADDDGVVFVPRLEIGDIVEKCGARLNKEASVRARLAKGELGLDIYGMREALAKAGLVYVNDVSELK